MIRLPGYRVEELIYEGLRTRVYRGFSEALGRPVVIKVHREAYPGEQQMASFERAFALGRRLDCPGVIGHLALERQGGGLALVTEDFGAVALSGYMAEPLSLEQRLRIALGLTEGLAQLHAAGIVHRDVKPNNVVIHPASEVVKLIDLGISSRPVREATQPTAARLLEGTLAYIAPEQTGRMNRSVDFRADLYSLGATLYELFTGRLPFVSQDPIELIHCHLARVPAAPHEVAPELAGPLSAVIQKLLAKIPEDRYQTADGLHRDLARCLSDLARERPIAPFEPGADDVSPRLQVSQRLYGRERELEALLGAFEVAAEGERRLLLVSGYSGVGKSSLVHEVHKPIVGRRGAFCAGKFDQFRRDLPYLALVEALRDLVRQELTGAEERVRALADDVRGALGRNAAVIADVIPELLHLIGEAPPVPQLPPVEAQNRFDRAFQAFLRVFARADHPLVLFVDDLQWADLPSLALLEVLIGDPDGHHLLIVGAYRDNEVGDDHPLHDAVRRLTQAGQAVQRIELQPLPERILAQMLGEALRRGGDDPELAALARLVHAKTQGNPFFVGEFMGELERRSLVRLDRARGAWAWELAPIEAAGITDNVVDLMSRKLEELPPETRAALQVAACVGAEFELSLLARALQETRGEASRRLTPALEAGMVLPLDATYKYVEALSARAAREAAADTAANPRYRFLHDRVQQATHESLSAAERARLHLVLGRELLAGRAPDALGEDVIDVANHLDLARELVTAAAERLELARLNLAAGRRAKASLATGPSGRYLRVGLELLPADAWSAHYALALALHTELVEVSYLATDFAALERLARVALDNARTHLDRVPIVSAQIRAQVAQARYREAVDLALSILRELGVSLPRDPGLLRVLWGYLRFKRLVRRRDLDGLLGLPELTDPRARAALGVLASCATSAYYVAPNLLALIGFTMAELALRHGNCELTAYGFGLNGMILSGALGDVAGGYAFGKLAAQLIDRYPENEFHGKTKLFFDGFIRHWKDPLEQPPAALLADRRSALTQGDLENSVYCGVISLYTAFLRGEPLDALRATYAAPIRQMRLSKQAQTIPIVEVWAQALETLASEATGGRLEGDRVRAAELLPTLDEQRNYNALFHCAFVDGVLAHLFGDHERALARLELAERHVEAVLGQSVIPALAYYQALAAGAAARAAEGARRRRLRRLLARRLRALCGYARHSAWNHAHRVQLVVAEQRRLGGNTRAAEELYRAAIRGARERGFRQDEALAHERLGELYVELGVGELAEHYLASAHALTLRWGARGKAQALVQRWGPRVARGATSMLTDLRHDPTLVTETVHEADAPAGGLGGLLDVATVLKASQAIAAETVLDRLLVKLIEIVLENAGAERGVFLVHSERGLTVEAAGSIHAREVAVLQGAPLRSAGVCSPAVVEYVARTRERVVLDDASNEPRFSGCPYVTERKPRSLLCAPVVKQTRLVGVLYLENHVTSGAFTPDRLQILEVIASEVAIAVDNARLYGELREKNLALEAALGKVALLEKAKLHLSKFVPRHVQARIEENPAAPGLERSERDVSILFLDIAGYTRMSESVDPVKVSHLVERYFSAFLDDIHRNHGDINETAGDGLMILFQDDDPAEHAARAVATALAIRDKTRQINAELAPEAEPVVVNMGINSGAALVGSIRFEGLTGTRWTYTASGTVTNVAARIAAHAEHGAVLVSEETSRRVRAKLAHELEALGPLQFKNVTGPVEVYRFANPERVASGQPAQRAPATID